MFPRKGFLRLLGELLKRRAVGAARRNPTRFDLVERIEELIAESTPAA